MIRYGQPIKVSRAKEKRHVSRVVIIEIKQNFGSAGYD
jgi:hypothetical protein